MPTDDRPPVGAPGDPFTAEGLVRLLVHVAEIQANLPLSWAAWERTRIHAYARWVRSQFTPVRVMGEAPPVSGKPDPVHDPLGLNAPVPFEAPRMALALTAADAPTAPEPPALNAESALRTAPDAAWRAAWRAGWVTGWVNGAENRQWRQGRGPLQPSDAGR